MHLLVLASRTLDRDIRRSSTRCQPGHDPRHGRDCDTCTRTRTQYVHDCTEYAFPEHDRESCQALAAAESFRADGWNTKIPGTSKEGCDAQNP